MQINRLFEIVYILLERKKVTAQELAEKFEVSTRTIYRGIEIFERELPKIVEKKPDFNVIRVESEISKDLAYRVYDEFKKENIIIKENGNFIVKFECPENDWVYGYILSFGEKLKVISPEYVKDIVKEKLEKSLKNYCE